MALLGLDRGDTIYLGVTRREGGMKLLRWPLMAAFIVAAGLLQSPAAFSNGYPCTGNETVMLIQDVPPWGRDVIISELLAQRKDFCVTTSDAIPASLNRYREIILAGAQPQTYYDNLFPGGIFHRGIADWVRRGGTLTANLTDCGRSFGSWSFEACSANPADSYTFMLGIGHAFSRVDDNDITLQGDGHPIITGRLGGPNGGAIVDIGPQNDLDDWGWSSHGYFTNLPPGTEVILTQPDVTGDGQPEPVMIEFGYGMGRVIASLVTIEWRYLENPKLLANEIGYQDCLAWPPIKMYTFCRRR